MRLFFSLSLSDCSCGKRELCRNDKNGWLGSFFVRLVLCDSGVLRALFRVYDAPNTDVVAVSHEWGSHGAAGVHGGRLACRFVSDEKNAAPR